MDRKGYYEVQREMKSIFYNIEHNKRREQLTKIKNQCNEMEGMELECQENIEIEGFKLKPSPDLISKAKKQKILPSAQLNISTAPSSSQQIIIKSDLQSLYNVELKNQEILQDLLKEVKIIREEIKELKNHDNMNCNVVGNQTLKLPRTTVDEFLALEEDCSKPYIEKALKAKFNNIHDQSLDKFVRECIKTIITDEAACNFTWFGNNDNMAINSFYTMNIIIECSMAKFPTSRTHETITVIKKWFQYAKTRQRKPLKML